VNEKLKELQRIKESLLTMEQYCKSCSPGEKAPDCTIVDAGYSKNNEEQCNALV